MSDNSDSDFLIEDDCVCKGFDQHELSDLTRDRAIEEASELLASRLREKNLLEKKLRYHTFEPEKMNFCNTLEVMVVFYIAIIYEI